MELARRALLIADHDAVELGPLVSEQPACLLPVGGRPVLLHALDELYEVGVRELWLAISSFPEQIRGILESGERWGMEMHYVLTRGDASEDEILSQVHWDNESDYLIAHADRVRGRATRAFAKQAQGLEVGRIDGHDGRGEPLGLSLVRPEQRGKSKMILEDASVESINTPQGLYVANCSVLDGRLPVDGHTREIMPGLLAGNGLEYEDDLFIEGQALLGARCHLGKQVRLGPNVMMGRRVFVDDGAEISHSLILPESYIGAGLKIEGAILSGDYAVDIATGRVERARNSALLSKAEPGMLSKAFEGLLHQLFATVLFLLSLPLWPAMLLASLVADPSQPIRRRELLGNRRRGGVRRAFVLHEPATRLPILRSLTQLAPAVLGHIRLVGVTSDLLEPVEGTADESPWMDVLAAAPVGLVSPGRHTSDDPLEAQLADVLYAQRRNLAADLWLFLSHPFRTHHCPRDSQLTPS